MESEQSARIEKMERMQEEMREQMAGDLDEIRKQMFEMMQMMKAMVKRKTVVETSPSKEEGRSHDSSAEPVYPSGFIPPQHSHGVAAQVHIPVGGQSHMLTSQHKDQEPNFGGNFVNPSYVPNLDDPLEQEKWRKSGLDPAEDKEMQQKYDLLEERLRAVEGKDNFDCVDADELSLVPDLVIPPKFKVPEFTKYDGTTCPVTHITMFCRKMAGYTHNEKLLIHCFQDSLTGSATRWYVQLDRGYIHSWKDLAKAFKTQYKHVIDMAPDRLSLQNMEKKASEGFKEYAQRWRDMATQVYPPLTEKEMTILFINSLRAPYYEKLVGNATKDFADLVVAGEMIENAIKNGRIEASDASNYKKGANSKWKEGETNNINFGRRQSNNVSYPARSNYRSPLDPIPMTYAELFPQLVEKHLIAPIHLEPFKPPYPKWYDENARCEYHSGNPGHTIENCSALKYRVQGLINAGILNFSKNEEPNVNSNPLPNHAGKE